MSKAAKDLKLFKADIEFKVNDREVKFSVVHNLPKTWGLNIENALDNWLFRTKHYTAKNFCKYVMSKDPSFVCMTMEQYNHLSS